MSWFRIVSTLSFFLFLWYVFPHVIAHRREIFVTVWTVYAVIFLSMCRRVQEGEYPPPAPTVRRSLLGSYEQYFCRCLSVGLYRRFFLLYVLMVSATTCAGSFVTLFARVRLGLEMGELGKILAWGLLASALTYLPMGWVCDRVRAIYVVFAGVAGMMLMALGAYLFVHDRVGWQAYIVFNALPQCAWGLGWAKLNIELLPSGEYAQLSGGTNVFAYGGLVMGNYALGALMDRLGSRYEMAFLWSAAMEEAALAPLLMLYRGWRQHGGPYDYTAPAPVG